MVEYLELLSDEDFGMEWIQELDSRDAPDHKAATAGLQARALASRDHLTEGFGAEFTDFFTQLHIFLVETRLVHWMFPADEPELAFGLGTDFLQYRYMAKTGADQDGSRRAAAFAN